MADCSELAENLVKIGMALATREDIKTFDDMALAMQQIFPALTRDGIIDAFLEVQESRKTTTSDIQKKLMAIYNEPRIEKNTKEKIKELNEFLETGDLPKTKEKKTASDTTQMLRSILYDLRKQLNRSEPARTKRIEKSIADLEEKLKSGDILPKPKPPLAESKELDKLIYKQEFIRKEIRDAIRKLKPLTLWGKVAIGWDLVRLMMTTGEFSFALRQGGVYAFSHPAKWSKALVNSFKSFGSSKGLYDVNKDIYNRELAPYYQKSGLAILHEGMSLTQSEEVIMNYWQDKLPVLRNFNRAAIGFFNTMRADMFDLGYKTLGQTEAMTQEEMEIWSNYINVMSGRGKLSIGSLSLEPAALALNRAFFSARYVASRFQMLGGAVKTPFMSIAGQNKRAYRMITREYIRLGLGLATIYGLGMLVGADIEEDPRSTDFGKLKFGNRRLDVMMGVGQIITFMSRLATGTTKTGKGDIVALRERFVFGKAKEKQYGGRDIEDVLGKFLRSKLSPQFGFAMNVVTGETYTGEEVSLLNNASQLLYPMTYGDLYDAMKEEGMPTNAALTALTLLGMGLQTYNPEENAVSKQTAFGNTF